MEVGNGFVCGVLGAVRLREMPGIAALVKLMEAADAVARRVVKPLPFVRSTRGWSATA